MPGGYRVNMYAWARQESTCLRLSAMSPGEQPHELAPVLQFARLATGADWSNWSSSSNLRRLLQSPPLEGRSDVRRKQISAAVLVASLHAHRWNGPDLLIKVELVP